MIHQALMSYQLGILVRFIKWSVMATTDVLVIESWPILVLLNRPWCGQVERPIQMSL